MIIFKFFEYSYTLAGFNGILNAALCRPLQKAEFHLFCYDAVIRITEIPIVLKKHNECSFNVIGLNQG